MAKTIIGVENCKGVFQGEPFSGLRLHLTEEKKNVFGQTANKVYIKTERAANLMTAAKGDFKTLIGQHVEIYFDEWKKASKVDLVD